MTLKSTLMAAVSLATISVMAARAERGADGHLNLLYWQAPSILNPFLSGGIKDTEASSMILEPLARHDENGHLVPWLVREIPTVENGGVSVDMTTITWRITPGLKWSDGTDFTAHDVVFTSQYCMSPEGGCQQESKFFDVKIVEALDDLTVKVTFEKPKPFPYGPFVGHDSPILQQAQFIDCIGAAAPNCTAENFGPHGTGPFRVTDFKANDVLTLEANPFYRDPEKPGFATVTLKGGGDAAGAARAVLQTGEFDYAWNLQIDPSILADMAKDGKGEVITAFGAAVERMQVNLTNPDPALGADRSTLKGGAHPFLTDPIVNKSLSMAIDRSMLAEIGYGAAGKPTCNVLPAPALYTSAANDDCLTQDIPKANQMLDDAGWQRGSDGIRSKDGVRLSILFQTSTNAVRQDTQAIVKSWWNELGVEVELKNVEPAVYFGGSQSSPDTYQKQYSDIGMFTNTFTGSDPETYMNNWTCAQIPAPDNNWLGFNIPRFCNADYDALAAKMSQTAVLDERAALAIEMNDMLVQNGALIPLVHRGDVSAHAKSLSGVRMNSWDSELWNIADWGRVQ